MRLPIDLMTSVAPPDIQYKSVTDYAKNLTTTLKETFRTANEHLTIARRRQQKVMTSGLKNDHSLLVIQSGFTTPMCVEVEFTTGSYHGWGHT